MGSKGNIHSTDAYYRSFVGFNCVDRPLCCKDIVSTYITKQGH